MEKFLSNKKILFISTKYFGYDKEIRNSIKQTGAYITFYYDDPFDYLKFINARIVQHKLSAKAKQYAYDKLQFFILRRTRKNKFDFIFFLKGSLLTVPFLTALRAQHPEAIFIQYQWDSIRNYNYQSFLPFFELSFSFDITDAQSNSSIQYLPMFARDEFYELKNKRQTTKQVYDVLFVGSNHSNRLLSMRKLQEQLYLQGYKVKSFVYLPFLVGLNGVFITRQLKKDELMFGAVTKNKLKRLLLATRYVLDLPSPGQTGVTPRALEALASGCSLITTNVFIKEEPFYKEASIKIIDPDTSLTNSIAAMLKQPYAIEAQVNVEAYALSNWIKNIFQRALCLHEKAPAASINH